MSEGVTFWGRIAGYRIALLPVTIMAAVMLVLGPTFMAVGCSSSDAQDYGDGTASDEMYALAGDLIEAMNDRYSGAATDLYTEDAVFDDRLFNEQSQGRDEILKKATEMVGLGATFGLSGRPIQVGDVLIQPVTFLSNGEQVGQGAWVFLVNGDNQVTHQWLNGRVRTDN